MTTTLLHLFNFFYLVLSVVVAILTRATPRRIAGALAGGAASGVVTLCLIALWERLGWWHMVIPWEPYFLTLSLICMTLCAFIFSSPGGSPAGSAGGGWPWSWLSWRRWDRYGTNCL
jgi:hypothetical protein